MAKTIDTKTILLMDDELFNVQWLIDFLEAQEYGVVTFANADEALQAISQKTYRAAILDLNVPMVSEPQPGPQTDNSVYRRYPGLYVAWHARNKGYRGRQVVIYTVHRDEEVSGEAESLGCTYIVKGRPRDLKEEIARVLSHDPTAATAKR